MEVSIHPLRCPNCGSDLAGLDNDVLFFCRNCVCGYETGDASLMSKSPRLEEIEKTFIENDAGSWSMEEVDLVVSGKVSYEKTTKVITTGDDKPHPPEPLDVEPKGKVDFRKIPIISQSPPEDADSSSLLWLPMWAFKYKVNISAPSMDEGYVKQILDACPWVWVTAFRAWRPSYFGDPGMLYTSKAIAPEMKPPEAKAIPVGCAVSEIEARDYPMPTLLALVDRRVDVAPIDIYPRVTESRLVAVPFIQEGGRIKDTQMDWNWPEIFIEDIASLRNLAVVRSS